MEYHEEKEMEEAEEADREAVTREHLGLWDERSTTHDIKEAICYAMERICNWLTQLEPNPLDDPDIRDAFTAK